MEPINKGLTSVKAPVRNDTGSIRNAQTALVDDFRSLISDAEQLVNSITGASGDGLASARDRFVSKLEQAKAACGDTERALRARVEHAADATTTYVSENPVRALVIAAAVGAFVGYLMQRRD